MFKLWISGATSEKISGGTSQKWLVWVTTPHILLTVQIYIQEKAEFLSEQNSLTIQFNIRQNSCR